MTRRRPPGWTGATMTPTRLVLVRHGQTAFSAAGRFSGRGDPELTELGVRQAAAVAAELRSRREAGHLGGTEGVAAVVTSPLRRTHATAVAVGAALGLPVTVHEGLIEADFGRWDGLSFREIAEGWPEELRRWMSDTSVVPPAGESFDAVAERVAATRAELTETYGHRDVVLVSHVSPIKSILREALDSGPSLLYRLHLDLTSVSVAEYFGDGGSCVRAVNDIGHLYRGGIPVG